MKRGYGLFFFVLPCWLTLSMTTLLPRNAAAATLELSGTRISVEADHAPLRDVLALFGEYGVRVAVDPVIDKRITTRFRDRNIERALADLAAPYSFALVWEQIEGPLGHTPRLHAIRVFRVGREEDAEPLSLPRTLRIARGWDGTEFVADELLVGFAPGTTAEAFHLLLGQIGATVIECNRELGVYRLRFAPGTNIEALARQLAANERVAAVEPNYAHRLSPPLPAAPPGTPVPATDAPARPPPRVRAEAGGLAVLDSGLGEIAGLEAVLAGTYDAFDPDATISDPVGHGTQMALVAAGVVVPGGGQHPSREGAPLLAVRSFDAHGYTSNADLMRAVNYALDEGAKVLSLSWGTETESTFLAQTMAYAQQRDAVIVASAGNEPSNKPVYPAAYPGVLGVAATTAEGAVWEQSNYGDFVALAAPGTAKMPVGYMGPPGSYAGTSIAAAYVARVLADYRAAHPEANAQEAATELVRAVSQDAQRPFDPRTGYGLLDADALERLFREKSTTQTN